MEVVATAVATAAVVIEAVGVDLAARMTRVGVKRAVLCASAKRARALRNACAL